MAHTEGHIDRLHPLAAEHVLDKGSREINIGSTKKRRTRELSIGILAVLVGLIYFWSHSSEKYLSTFCRGVSSPIPGKSSGLRCGGGVRDASSADGFDWFSVSIYNCAHVDWISSITGLCLVASPLDHPRGETTMGTVL